ncbi:MAG TPA: hypothetical protein VKF59_14290 [Candidatus Dormibacteraeota bacterium]|nr:hypothetical protein [Candidatus Dormibacteraeota bacterium]
MPRTPRETRTSARGRARGTRSAADSRNVVTQISQIVAANEALQRQVRELQAENDSLSAQLREIGDALGRVTGGPRRSARGRAVEAAAEPQRRQRRPITDPAMLERRRQALAKARAARSEKLAAARAAASQSSDNGQ